MSRTDQIELLAAEQLEQEWRDKLLEQIKEKFSTEVGTLAHVITLLKD